MGRLRKALGSRGSWFARVDDEELPCVWTRWLSEGAKHYLDPGAKSDETKWVRYAEAIKRLRRVILIQQLIGRDGTWHREAYIGIFRVENVEFAGNRLEFDLVDRLESQQP
jgi:hypothetical protein